MTYTPAGDGWIEGPPFPPDLQHGPIEVVRYTVARIGTSDHEQVWHRPFAPQRITVASVGALQVGDVVVEVLLPLVTVERAVQR